ncbi:11042_t:CDS:2, partial [Racocetra persica]
AYTTVNTKNGYNKYQDAIHETIYRSNHKVISLGVIYTAKNDFAKVDMILSISIDRWSGLSM